MNKKDVLRIIKAKADKIEYPDLTDKILSKIDFSNTECETVSEKETTVVTLGKTKKKTRKVLIPFMATLISALLIVVLLLFPHHITPGPEEPKGEETLYKVTKLKTMIGYELYNGASLIDFNTNNTHLNLHKSKKPDTEVEDNTEENQNEEQNQDVVTPGLTNKQIAGKIQDAVVASDMLINKEKFKVKLDKSDKSGYQVAMKCSYEDSDGHKVTYDFYYNETPDHPEDHDYEDIDEVNSTIDGVMYIDNQEYKVSGSKEVENNESEIELKFYFDELNYFIVSQEMSVDENEYKYMLYKEGKLYQQISHSIETEGGKKEATYEVKDSMNNVDDVISLEFNGTIITGKLQSPLLAEEVEVSIDIKKKEYIYHFSDGIISIPKN